MDTLQKIVKVTQQQYDILKNNGTVGDYTGLNSNYIYLVQEDYNDITYANLNSTASLGTSGLNQVYPIGLDDYNKLAVHVPWNNTTYLRATNTSLGLIKPWYSTTGKSNYNGSSTAPSAGNDAPSINTRSTTSGRYYPVEMDANGRAYVNVPWTSYSLPNASLNTVGGVRAYFGAASGGEGNFELFADIQQGNNTIYIRAGQFKQTSGSSSSSTRFTFKRPMNKMGNAASYVAVILGDSYGQSTNGQWMGSLAVNGSSYTGFDYRASNTEKGHVYYIGIGFAIER